MKSTGDSNGPGQVVDRRQLDHQQPVQGAHHSTLDRTTSKQKESFLFHIII
jgi:hypothetical protein